MSRAIRCRRVNLVLVVIPFLLAAAEPNSYRLDDYRAPVPESLKGAETLDTAGVILRLASDPALLLIDVLPLPPRPSRLAPGNVWQPVPHEGLPGAIWLPNVGYGSLAPAMMDYFRQSLAQITGNNLDRPLLFYCRAACWMSWNAAKRALELGYRRVLWYPDGSDGWQAAGQTLVVLTQFADGPPAL